MRQEDHLVLWGGLRGAASAFPGSAACVSSPLHSWRVGLQHHPTAGTEASWQEPMLSSVVFQGHYYSAL